MVLDHGCSFSVPTSLLGTNSEVVDSDQIGFAGYLIILLDSYRKSIRGPEKHNRSDTTNQQT